MFRYIHQGEARAMTPRQLFAGAQDYTITAAKYMGGKVETAVIGDIREIISSPPMFEKMLKEKGIVRLGLLGNIMKIKPPSKEFLAELLRTLDEQPKSRIGYKALDEMTDGSPFFSEATGDDSLHKRKQVLAYLSDPKTYAAAARSAVEAAALISDMDSESVRARKIVQHLLAKGIFGVDRLPPETNGVLQKFDHEFEKYAQMAAFPKIAKLLTESKHDKEERRQVKAAFAKFVQDFLQIQLPHILEAIKSGAPGKPSGSLTADVILELMDREGVDIDRDKLTAADIQKYFSHPDVTSLHWIFLAGTNISKTVAYAFELINDISFSLPYWQMAQMCVAQLIRDYKKPLKLSEIEPKVEAMAEQYVKEFKEMPFSATLPNNGYFLRHRIMQSVHSEFHDAIHRKPISIPYSLDYSLDDLKKVAEGIAAKIQKGSQKPKEVRDFYDLIENVRKGIGNLFDEEGEVQARALQTSPELDKLFDHCLKRSVSDLIIVRYTDKAVKIGDIEIPAKTYIQIELGVDHFKEGKAFDEKLALTTAFKQDFRFFASGPRKCPGSRIAEYIFKGAVVESMRCRELELLKAVERLSGRREAKDEEKSALASPAGPEGAGKI